MEKAAVCCLSSRHLLGCWSELRLGGPPAGTLRSPALLPGRRAVSRLCRSLGSGLLPLKYPAQALAPVCPWVCTLCLHLAGVFAPGRAAPVLERVGVATG